MRFFFLILLSFCIVSINAQQFNSKLGATVGETQVELNDVWKFKTDASATGENEKWFSTTLNDKNWENIDVPGNWDLINEHANYKGKAWYRTSFVVPSTNNDERIFLAFGEVGMSYKVFVNGYLVAQILSGNYEEQFDITKHIIKTGKNYLAVEVDNALIWGAYWPWGGIRRPVKLSIKKPLFIERQAVVAEPDLVNGTAIITTNIVVKNTSRLSKKFNLAQNIYFNGTLTTTIDTSSIVIPANTTANYTLTTKLTKQQVSLWHFDYPNLYTSAVSVSQGNKIIYQQQNRFGIRKIEIDGFQFKLNGESVRLAGYNWVADDRTTGSTLPEFRYKEDIDLMKAAGANMARLSHRPLPEDVMNYLDEKGILVMAELNNWPEFMNGSSKEPELFATKLIQQNFNHPCIFGWSVGNENGSLKDYPQVNDYTASIIKYIKQNLDSSRLVTYVSNTADFQDNDAAQFCDVIMINKYGSYEKGVDELKKRYPNKAVFMSEYGSHTDNLIYDTPDKTTFKSLMVDNLTAKENLFGYSIWTFNDYRSNYQAPNPLTTTPVHQNRQWGIVDVYRNKKRAYAQMQQFYAPVRQLIVNAKPSSGDKIQAKIVLHPRYKKDIPAYVLKGYNIVWQLRNSDNKVFDAGGISLPNIQPGADSLVFNIDCANDNAGFFKVSLMSPTGYSVLDTVCYLQVPPAPTVESFITASKEARIVFAKSDFTKEFVVKYKGEDDAIKSLKPTIDHYADLTSLSLGKKYEIWVTGINAIGESKPSAIYHFTPTAGYKNLPPIIWQSEPANKSFFVGYSYHYTDVQYDIRYGTSLANRAHWNVIASNNFGMMQVPNLTNNQTYYYQIGRRPAFTNTISEWSEIKTIVPNKSHQYGKAIVHGFKQLNKQVIVFLSPSKNATSYQIICNTDKGKEVFIINQSVVEIVSLTLNTSNTVTSIDINPI